MTGKICVIKQKISKNMKKVTGNRNGDEKEYNL